MSDYIKREYKLPNGGTVTADFDDLGIAKITIQAMDALFDILNSSDVVEVVRCKDCKYLDKGENDSESWCECTAHFGKYFAVDENGFCSYGKRAEK